MTVSRYANSVWVDVFTATQTSSDRGAGTPGTYKPSASTAGLLPGWTRSQLATVTGTQTITTGNQTITGKNFTGRVIIQAPNLHFSNCWFGGGSPTSFSTGCVDATNAAVTGLLIEDSVLAADQPNTMFDGIVGHDYTVRRCELFNVVDHFGVFNTFNSNGPANVLIEANYGHDLSFFDPDPSHSDNRTHNDCVQIQGNSAITIRGNTLLANAASSVGTGPSNDPYYPSVTGQAIGITPNVGAVTGVLIESNWLDYGAQSITVITGSFAGSTVGTIQNNRFGHSQPLLSKSDGSFRRAIGVVPAQTLTGMRTTTGADTQGNVYEDTGLPVTVYRETYF